MAGRKLNRRQQWRIEKIQDERRARLERKQVQLEQRLHDEGGLGAEQTGLVIASFGASLEVEASDGARLRCQLRQNLPLIVVGDRVVWQTTQEGGVVTALLERRSLLARPDSHGALRGLAANLDQIIVVAAPAPAYSTELIDQYLAAAELTGITPLLLFNKIDLIGKGEGEREGVERLLQRYRDIGYRVLTASTRLSHGLDALVAELRDHTSVFVGQSGVGKSSLGNALMPGVDIAVQALSAQSGLGQHTTSTARLYHLPQGGSVIDSPGVREFRLWPMSEATLAEGFREFHPLLGHCKFRDCKHQREPGCALKGAVEAGVISAERLRSYHKIAAQLKEFAADAQGRP
ncbi:MAG: small ribosomal subunit biogenesis GTPase RsgA [Gammaproteobacteria bacterium]|nr:small ribosomal subunit biogenesis GTPase RsgA [Gammaproteobacteria bacterium]